MKHFIEIHNNYSYYCYYYYNNKSNKIGDFSAYYCVNNYWDKHRMYRGGFVYSKKPHRSDSNGDKEWYYDGKWYDSYEEYILAVMG